MTKESFPGADPRLRPKQFATEWDSSRVKGREPIPEGAFIVRETRVNEKATFWQRMFADDLQIRYVPVRVGADGYLYGDYDAATEWK